MKHRSMTILLTVLMSMVGVKVSAHDFCIRNADNVPIYYIENGDGTVSVSFQGDTPTQAPNEYSGRVIIPSSVVCGLETYTVTGINYSAFLNCTGLTYVYIPNTVKRINNTAFYGCSALTSIRIPSSMTYIGENAFSHSGLTYVVFGNTTTSITDDAFAYCQNLTDVYCYSKQVVNADRQFFGLYPNYNANMTLHAPSGSVASYQNNSSWSRYFKAFVALKDDDPRIIGDVTGDGDVNAADIVEVANIILGK